MKKITMVLVLALTVLIPTATFIQLQRNEVIIGAEPTEYKEVTGTITYIGKNTFYNYLSIDGNYTLRINKNYVPNGTRDFGNDIHKNLSCIINVSRTVGDDYWNLNWIRYLEEHKPAVINDNPIDESQDLNLFQQILHNIRDRRDRRQERREAFWNTLFNMR